MECNPKLSPSSTSPTLDPMASSSLLLLLLGLSSIMAKKTCVVHMKRHHRPSVCPIPSIMAKKAYVVPMKCRHRPSVYPAAHDWYSANLQSLSPSSGSDSLLCAYTSAYNVFFAYLDASEADALRGSDSVLSVCEVHTTRILEFDTGVCPESKSFDDTGMPETRWRGLSESGSNFNKALCSRKLMCARSFSIGFNELPKVKAAAASVETAGKEEFKALANMPIDEEGNVSNTSSQSEGSHEENVGQADNKKGWVVAKASEKSGEKNKGWLLGMVVRLIKASKIGMNYGVFKFEIPLRALWGDGDEKKEL